MAQDYYDLLGVSKTASADEIKKAFRKLAHQHHPDKEGGDEAKFKEINAAYQVLSDEGKRAQYDQFGHAAFSQGAGAGPGAGGFSWEDIMRQGGYGGQGGVEFDFGDAFGDLFGMGGRGQQQSTRMRGSDLETSVTIEFRDAVFGVKKDITIQRMMECTRCHGTTAEPDTKVVACPTCKGSGQVMTTRRVLFGNIQTAAICPDCEGRGKKPEKPCHECYGKGSIRGKETLSVSIPGGIDDRERIRLTGQGDIGRNGGPSGDLYIGVHVKKDPRYVRDDSDLILDLPIRFSQAAVGDTMDIETLDGSVQLKIPAGIQSGHRLRLKGLGVSFLHKSGRGDLFVEVRIDTPQHLSRKQREIVELMKKEGL